MLLFATLPGATAPGYRKTAPLGRRSVSNIRFVLFIQSSRQLVLFAYLRQRRHFDNPVAGGHGFLRIVTHSNDFYLACLGNGGRVERVMLPRQFQNLPRRPLAPAISLTTSFSLTFVLQISFGCVSTCENHFARLHLNAVICLTSSFSNTTYLSPQQKRSLHQATFSFFALPWPPQDSGCWGSTGVMGATLRCWALPSSALFCWKASFSSSSFL